MGGRVGFTVDAASFPDSSGGRALEIYVRITPTTLGALSRDFQGAGRLRLTARLVQALGAHQSTASQELEIVPSDTSQALGKVVVLKFPARPGTQRLMVRLEDLLSRKRGLIYLARRVVESGSVEGDFVVQGPEKGRDLSDLEFVWAEAQAGQASSFWRADRAVIPDPERLYGLFATDVRASFVARSLSGEARPWHWGSRVYDSRGRVVAGRDTTGGAGEWLRATASHDLSGEPAGGYDLEVRVWQEGDRDSVVRRAHFSLAWQADSWLRNPRDIQDNVHFLLQPDDEDAFALMQPGEQESYWEEFWRRRDPTPGTAVNEARATFLQRVDYANHNYAHISLERGMFSDMGRVYIRYGQPSDILRQVFPTGDNTLLQAIQELVATEERPIGDVHQKGLGGDMRPFEVWIYEGDIPLPPDADPSVSENRRYRKLVFLFVDEQGLGDYRLRYSTE
ncbi:MAG: GWxTD domain-containing protein [Candidatus Eisenbacteria bacterium]|uniref:GWxTD domain-containing protein n=1 Tax=Eiseniibacteriota bacterium TaxID=2212470 RepID=A0A538SAG2_UNCEI|nr:MAG: GWxTD domain-containing protein [Candidatus Eisenbacteria bacterium]